MIPARPTSLHWLALFALILLICLSAPVLLLQAALNRACSALHVVTARLSAFLFGAEVPRK